MNRAVRLIAFYTFCLLLLTGCMGAGEDSESNSLAGGGIGGTGKGTVTGYGSIIVNDSRYYAVDSETRITMDGEPVSEEHLRALGTGLVVRVSTSYESTIDRPAGTAREVIAEHLVIGPVTSRTPLRVLGQDVVVTGDTVNAGGRSVADLLLGDVVRVSGYADSANTILASRVEFMAEGWRNWLLTGPVKALVPGDTLIIGFQRVAIANVPVENCAEGLALGSVVKVLADADPEFKEEDMLESAFQMTCVSPGLGIHEDGSKSFEAVSIEGLAENISLPEFTLDGVRVITAGNAMYEGGKAEDIVPGVKVEAEGILDTATGILTATRLRFRDIRVRIEAPRDGDLNDPTFMGLLGLNVRITPLTRIEGNLSSGGSDDEIQLEMHGFVDENGEVYASRVKAVGTAEPKGVRLRGPVSDFLEGQVMKMLGLEVKTHQTREFTDADGETLTLQDFKSAIAPGIQVDVQEGVYDLTGEISKAESIQIEQ